MKRKPIPATPAPVEAKRLVVEDQVDVPYDPINEQALIAAACLDLETRQGLVQRIKADLFLLPKHQVIWEALVELTQKDLDFHLGTIRQLRPEADVDYLTELLELFPTIPPNLQEFGRRLLWDRSRANVAAPDGPLIRFVNLIRDPGAEEDQLRRTAREISECLEIGGLRSARRDPSLLRAEVMANLQDKRNWYYPYGLPGLDEDEEHGRNFPVGAGNGFLTVITATSGGRKSTFVRQLALAQGPGIKCLGIAGNGRRVPYFAWEEKPKLVLPLMACMSLGFDRGDFLQKRFNAVQLKQLDEEMQRIQSFVHFFPRPKKPRGKRTNDDVLDEVRDVLSSFGGGFAVFDLFHRGFSWKWVHEEAECLDGMQQIVQDCDVHAALLHQQKLKELEKNPDKRPKRDTNKGASDWVDVGDAMLGVDVPALWKTVPDVSVLIHVLKQRHGIWPFTIEMAYDAKTGLFSNGRRIEYRHEKESGSAVQTLLRGGRKKRKDDDGDRRERDEDR